MGNMFLRLMPSLTILTVLDDPATGSVKAVALAAYSIR